jgi:hypothetical protein
VPSSGATAAPAAAKAKPALAKASPRPAAAKARPDAPAKTPPPAGWATPEDAGGTPPGPIETVTTAVRAVGEIAQLGAAVGTQAVRGLLSKIPKP